MPDEARETMDSTENSKRKPRYQRPQVIRLDEMAKGYGASSSCGGGGGDAGSCGGGGHAGGTCGGGGHR